MHSRLLSRFLRSSTFCLLAFGLLAFLPSHAWAATDTVTSTADDGSAGTLRAVLAAASPGDTITFASGVTGTITLQSILTIAQPVTITGPGAANLALSGPGGEAATPFADMEISNMSGMVAISGLTIENGNNSYGNISYGSGGGVSVDTGANVSLTDCTITGNSAGYAGGGIENQGTATLTDCSVFGNVSYFAGGGIYSTGTLTLTDCFLTANAVYPPANSLQDVEAGGMYNAGTLTMVNCVFSGNGGLYDSAGLVNNGAATITGSSFTDNQSGGINNYSLSNVAAASLTLTNDILYSDGGQEVSSSGTATATASYCDIGDVLGPASGGGDGVTDDGNNINDNVATPAGANPEFEQAPQGTNYGNLQIGRISPCLGAGTADAPNYLPTDITGATRANPPAMGAYDAAELGTGSTSDTLATASSLNPSDYGQNVVVTATVTPTNSGGVQPSGTITFTVNGTAGSPITVTNGVATLNLGTDAPGTYTITATYSGDANYNATGPTSALTQTINQATPTITFTESPNPATTGQYFTLTATVSPPAGQVSGAAAPTGDVAIDGDEASLGNGVATLQESYSQPQSVTSTAVYGGDTNYTTVTATPVQFSVQGNDITGTSVSLSSSQEPSAVGQSVTFTAILNLSYVPSGTPAPTGTMTFIVDPSTSGVTNSSPVPITKINGQYEAQYTATGLTAEQHQIEANYSGDSYYGSSGTGTQLQIVYSGTTPTTITLASSANPSTYGNTVTITATVSPNPGGSFGTGENVIFTVDGQQSQFDTSLTNGVATYTSNSLSPGPHTISAIYAGDSTYAGSQSNMLTQTISGGVYNPTVTVMSSANPSVPGQSVTFSASVYSYAGGPVPTGTVEFYLNPTGPESTPFDTETLVNGYATSTAQTFNATETDTVYAVYSGDANDDPENASLTQVVSSTVNTGGGATATTTTLSSSANPSTVGQTVTITAAVAPSSGSGTPTGTVTFTVDGTAGSPVTLTSGSATYSSSALTQGSHSITVAYSGDSSYAASTSGTLTQTVNAASTTLTATTITMPTANPNPATTTQSVTVSAAVIPPTATGTVTFTVTPSNGTATTVTGSVAGGEARATVAAGTLPIGSYSVTASYGGDSSDSASTSAAATLTVSAPPVIHMFNPGLQMIAFDENYDGVTNPWAAPSSQPLDTYNGGPLYIPTTTLPQPGHGAWVYLSGNTDVYDTGAPVTGATSIALTQGWNLIGSPYSAPFPVASLQVKSGGSTYSLAQANQNLLAYTTLYTYPAGTPMGGNYTPVLLTDNLQPFTGYWLYAFKPCTLVMPVID